MEEPIAAWEDEGGSPARSVQIAMTGTVNQIAWADQIKMQVDAEFDRVREDVGSCVPALKIAINAAAAWALRRLPALS
jgi:hypothetical protein